MTSNVWRVEIVGGGPAGLSAAVELRRLGVGHVVVHEREQQAGGIPRHTDHLGFGVRDMHRVMGGPRYAGRLVRRARTAGADLRIGSTVFSIDDVDADAVILATGARERPRSARLIPGDRPAGVFTTGPSNNWRWPVGPSVPGRSSPAPSTSASRPSSPLLM